MTTYIRGLIKPVAAVTYVSTKKGSRFESVSLAVADSEDKAQFHHHNKVFSS